MKYSWLARSGRNGIGGITTVLSALLAVLLSGCETGTIGGGGLSWTPPSMREDGTALALSEIAGYRIYYSETEGLYTMPNSVYIDGAATSQASLPAETAGLGSYYVVMTTVDTDGRESRYSQPPLVIGGSM